jgi:hypothetical protein
MFDRDKIFLKIRFPIQNGGLAGMITDAQIQMVDGGAFMTPFDLHGAVKTLLGDMNLYELFFGGEAGAMNFVRARAQRDETITENDCGRSQKEDAHQPSS